MTPKEKAIELVDKMMLYSVEQSKENDIAYYKVKHELKKYQSKQCALIAVDEIIKSNPCYEDVDRGGNFMWNNNTYYWQEVKQEIEKL